MQPTQTQYTVEGEDLLLELIYALLPNYAHKLVGQVQKLQPQDPSVSVTLSHIKFGVFPYFDGRDVTVSCARVSENTYTISSKGLVPWQEELWTRWIQEGYLKNPTTI